MLFDCTDVVPKDKRQHFYANDDFGGYESMVADKPSVLVLGGTQ